MRRAVAVILTGPAARMRALRLHPGHRRADSQPDHSSIAHNTVADRTVDCAVAHNAGVRDADGRADAHRADQPDAQR